MSEPKHSPEPWRYDGVQAVVAGHKNDPMRPGETFLHREWYGGLLVCESIHPEDARRVVACVNFCAGVDTADLEALAAAGTTIGNVAGAALAAGAAAATMPPVPPVEERRRCPACEKLYADAADYATSRYHGGEHLCWARYGECREVARLTALPETGPRSDGAS